MQWSATVIERHIKCYRLASESHFVHLAYRDMSENESDYHDNRWRKDKVHCYAEVQRLPQGVF